MIIQAIVMVKIEQPLTESTEWLLVLGDGVRGNQVVNAEVQLQINCSDMRLHLGSLAALHY